MRNSVAIFLVLFGLILSPVEPLTCFQCNHPPDDNCLITNSQTKTTSHCDTFERPICYYWRYLGENSVKFRVTSWRLEELILVLDGGMRIIERSCENQGTCKYLKNCFECTTDLCNFGAGERVRVSFLSLVMLGFLVQILRISF